MSLHVDVVVVGAGAAGLAAAFAARRRDASVALVERGRLGGDCTWVGCVPSKALIEHSRRVHAGRRAGLCGAPDFAAVMEDVQATVHKVSEDESKPTLEAAGITVLEGQASFTGQRRLSVDGTTVTAKAIVIATGSAPLLPPVDGLSEIGPLTNETVFGLRSLPRRLAVLGGGPIGLELGQAFQRLGSSVTVLEGEQRVALKEEPEASELLRHVLSREGVTVVLGSFVTEACRVEDGTVRLRTAAGETVEADAVLSAVGRRPVTDGLALDRAAVALTDKGFIQVDERLRTSADGVYAVGDVTGGPQFTHAGYDMGSTAVANALGVVPQTWERRSMPWVTFTDPEVGRVGLTEAEAYERHGDDARVAYFPIAETDRAKLAGDAEGFVKLVAGPHPVLRGLAGGQLVGATVMCPTGGDVVHELALAMRARVMMGRLAQTVHAYPSWSLAVREAAAMFFFDHKGRSARPARPGSTNAGAQTVSRGRR